MTEKIGELSFFSVHLVPPAGRGDKPVFTEIALYEFRMPCEWAAAGMNRRGYVASRASDDNEAFLSRRRGALRDREGSPETFENEPYGSASG